MPGPGQGDKGAQSAALGLTGNHSHECERFIDTYWYRARNQGSDGMNSSEQDKKPKDARRCPSPRDRLTQEPWSSHRRNHKQMFEETQMSTKRQGM